MEKVIAVIVTYNRKELLIHGLEGVLNQTRPLEKVIIIDNASTDGTEDFLREKGYLKNPKIEYISQQENTGGAGGFASGMKEAMKDVPDWIWVMDDDVAPAYDCLEILLSYSNKHVRCLQPLHKYEDGAVQPLEYLFDPRSCSLFNPARNISFENGKEVTILNTTCFEGMLIHSDIVKKVGFPDPKFFLSQDDIIYGFLASYYTNIWYVKDAVLTRLIKPKASSPLSFYYLFRNRFLVRKHLSDINLYRPSQFWFRTIVLYFHLIIVSVKKIDFISILYITRGFIDGVRENFGKIKA